MLIKTKFWILPKMREACSRCLYLNRHFCVVLAVALTIVCVSVIGLPDSRYRRSYNDRRTRELRLQSILFVDLRFGRWDSSGKYKMFDNRVVGENYANLSKKSRVTLATQTDPKHFHHIYELTMHWKGPISVALFAAGEEERVVLKTQLRFFRRCYEDAASKMVFHLAVPKSPENGTWNLDTLEQLLFDLQIGLKCHLYDEAFKKIVDLWKPDEVKKATRETPRIFPQNHLRNLARKNCQTSFVFVTDVDIVPCFNLWEDLEKFLPETKRELLKGENSGEPKIAYVVPVYELDEKAESFPKSKKEMVELAKQGFARPFHQLVFYESQWYTNYTRWEKEDYLDEIRVAYNVTEFLPDYEPFYVARDYAPLYDERFVGYGFDRSTQVDEMATAGYTFSVLSPAFAVHWGLQTRERYPKWKKRQIFKNSKKIKAFRAELAARYGVDPY